VSPVIADLWQRSVPELKDQPGFAEAFLPQGRAPRVGEAFYAPAMAQTLRAIAESKGEAFYRGGIAGQIEAFARKHNGAMTAADLGQHRNDWCGTLHQDFGGVTLHEIPPNGQGIAALMALGILGQTDFASLAPNSVEALHLQIEAIKLAFADIDAYVADLDHMKAIKPADLLSSAYLKRRAQTIDRRRAQVFGAGAPKEGGTVCLAAADAGGMMVSYIQSNYAGFGSGVVVPGTGISLQNRGLGFTLEPGHPNQVGPNKRPFHTIIPGFVMKNGAPEMAFGLMGGAMQAQGHVQMMVRTMLWNQDPQTAADAPRWRFVSGLDVSVEPAIGEATISALAARGHRIAVEPPDASYGFGGAQLIRRIEGGYIAGSDPRKDGCAAGF
jgi:gamma-glutamyltranspeptidase/glutathione hydrolase